MEFMYEYSAAHNFFLYLNSSTPTSSEVTTSLVPPPPAPVPPPLEAYDQAYYPTSSINDQQQLMMMNFQATDVHSHPPPQPLAEAAAAAPFIPYNQVQFSEGSSMMMDFSYINEDICSNNSSYYFETSREAKVLRYKEKKKRRNYEKKIRYPSRKAYADRRPRMRGRFVKVLDEDEQPPIAMNQYNQESTMALPKYYTQNCS